MLSITGMNCILFSSLVYHTIFFLVLVLALDIESSFLIKEVIDTIGGKAHGCNIVTIYTLPGVSELE